MSETETTVFEALTALLQLMGDREGYQRKLDALMAASTRAKEEAAGADRARAALAGARAEHDAECAERQAEAEAAVTLAAGRIAEAARRETRLEQMIKDIRDAAASHKRAIMRFARIDSGWNERLQGLPDYDALAEAALHHGDADDIDGHEHMGLDADEAAATALPAENLIAGSTLTKTGHRNGAGRRATQ
jgi:hypothetical protein